MNKDEIDDVLHLGRWNDNIQRLKLVHFDTDGNSLIYIIAAEREYNTTTMMDIDSFWMSRAKAEERLRMLTEEGGYIMYCHGCADEGGEQ